MSRGHQHYIATGHLGADAVVKAPQAGGLVAELRLAVTEEWKNREGERVEHTEWVRVKLFGRLAEIAQHYATRGRLVSVVGKLRTERWTDADNRERYSTWIYADELHLLGPREHATTSRAHAGRGDTGGAGEPPAEVAETEQGRGADDDDLPF